MTKIRTSQIDPGDGVDDQVMTLVGGKWMPADPAGGPSDPPPPPPVYSWIEDTGFDLSSMPAGAPGGMLSTSLLYKPQDDYSVQVIRNGLVDTRDTDFQYWEDPVGTYNIEVYGLRSTDVLAIRYMVAS